MDLALILILVAMALVLLAGMWFLVTVFNINPVYGAITFFIPLFGVCLIVPYWKKLKFPFYTNVMVLSLIVCGFTIALYQESKNVEAEPETVTLSQIMGAGIPSNHHLLISEHYRLYSESYIDYIVYEETGEEEISYVYTPIFGLDEFSEQPVPYQDGEFLLFVRSDAYESESDLPEDGVFEGLQGVVSSGQHSSIKELAAGDFGGIAFERMVVLDEGKKPTVKERLILIAVVSALCFVIFLGLLIHSIVMRQRMKKWRAAQSIPMPPPLPPDEISGQANDPSRSIPPPLPVEDE